MAIVQPRPPPLDPSPQLIVSSCGAADSGASHLHRVHVPAGADHQLAGRGEAVRQQGCRCRGLGQPGSYLLPQTAAGHWLLSCKPTLGHPSMLHSVSWRSDQAQCVSTGPVPMPVSEQEVMLACSVESTAEHICLLLWQTSRRLYHKLVVCQVMLQARPKQGFGACHTCAIIGSEAQNVCSCTHISCYYGRPASACTISLLSVRLRCKPGLSRGLVPAVPCAIIATEAQNVCSCTCVL